MKQKPAALAKVTRPVMAGVFPRQRLFAVLDGAREKPIIWVSGPPGCGKTTLVASYLDARDIPCLWYQLDEGDANPATFFYYMGLAAKQAAPRRRKPLPLLTPEYLPGIATFALRYFEDIYDRLKPPAVLVFDNYQEVSPESPFHEVIRHALLHVPEDINVIVISRREPHPVLMRTRASQLMEIIGWDELRLTLEESKGIAHTVKTRKLGKESIQHLHNTIEGWAAGLVLILRQAEVKGIDTQEIVKLSMEDIFDYFVGEAFQKMDAETQEFLLKTAFLPRMTAKMAEALTGLSSAGRILSELNRNYYFTERRPHTPPTYEYHALFREFLLSRVTQTLAPESLSNLRAQAATLLEEAGETEAAMALFSAVGDWETVISLIMKHAPSLLGQGRNQVLEAWLESLPEEMVDNAPWLSYWMGACRTPFDPLEGKRYFETAFEQFKIEKNAAGTLLSWSGVVNAIYLSFEGVAPLDPWISNLGLLLNDFGGFPSEEIEARVATSMFTALLVRQPKHPELEAWAERALSLTESQNDINARAETLLHLVMYHMFVGHFEKAEVAVDSLQDLARQRSVSPLARIILRLAEAVYYHTVGNHKKCLEAVSRGLELSERSGVHVLDHMLLGHAMYSYLDANDPQTVTGLFEKLTSLGSLKPWIAASFHVVKSRQALLLGDLRSAGHHAELASHLGDVMGCPVASCWIHLIRAQALHATGQDIQASKQVSRASNVARDNGLRLFEAYVQFAQAQFALDRGEEALGLATLSKALAVGKELGFSNTMVDQPSVTAALCVRALEAGIEVAYVQDIIRKRNLVPDALPMHLENWPWPLKTFTLGRFALVRDEKPVRFSGKAQQKPLSLLKALIALGGREVKEDQVADALWPEADGDMAHQSLATTLHRLRKLLGYQEAVQLTEGRLTLDPRYCWVDVWAFERMLGQADVHWLEGQGDDAVNLTRKAVDMYHGPFLGGEAEHQWMIPVREKLRSKLLRNVARLGNHLQQAGQWESALECYKKGLEVDNLAEEFYQRLMTCYQSLGRKADAIATYRTCQKTFSSILGVEPSPKTEAIYKSLLSE